MSKSRIFYILSLVILGVLLVFTVFRPVATGEEYSQVSRESLLQTEDGWIIQFDTMNREAQDTTYIIDVVVNDKPFRESFLIQSGGVYRYIHHINSREITNGKVSIAVFKEGEVDPFEYGTYYLK